MTTVDRSEITMKGKLRHVAIQCDDPIGSAEFYKRVFDMKEMNRIGLEDGKEAPYISAMAQSTSHSSE